MDDLDRAKTYELADRDAAVQSVLNNQSKQSQLLIDGAVHCLDCHEEIPLARLAVLPDANRCTDCQESFEGRR